MNGFTRQFAIRMPNRQLHGKPIKGEAVTDYSQSSVLNDVAGLGGLFNSIFGGAVTPEGPVIGHKPIIYETREAAQKQLIELRKAAEGFGVTNWGGSVVERLCTPFTSNDPAVQFRDAIVAWVAQQAGDQS